MMKTFTTILILSLLLSCTSTKEGQKEKVATFKTVTIASYSVERSGSLKRKEALKQSPERKKFFDEEGELVEYWTYEIDGTIYEKLKIIKNEEGKLKKRFTYDKDDQLKDYLTTELDDRGNVVEYKTYNSKDVLITIQKNAFDDRGNETSMENTMVKLKRTYKTTYAYNSDNEMIKRVEFNPDGTIRSTRTFRYNEKGLEVESELIKPNGDYTKFVSSYDEFDNLILFNWLDDSGMQKYQNSFTYVYDRHHNWITKKRYSNGKLGYVWERKIEYH